ncbi:MAG: ATP-grasp domain-containing protein [Xanthomonadales bacterium]|nr:ATP-grasp domain-containing protein [Xanthomonadales bacterium]
MNPNTVKPLNILVTGAGGAAAIAFFKAVQHVEGLQVHMADMDPHSTGLYLVPANRRCLLPPGAAADFSDRLLDYCLAHGITIAIPTVDCELAPVAAEQERFETAGIQLVLSPERALRVCYDKLWLMQSLEGEVELAAFTRFDDDFRPSEWEYPFVVKPRSGSGSRGVRIVKRLSDLNGIDTDGRHLVQEYLPGAEYSVDVYVAGDGRVVASVIRERIKVDSGIAVISKTVIDEEISELAARIARLVGIRFVANIQFRRDRDGRPRLLEINPRFPGTMSLTVAAGVNMPELCLREARGDALPKRLDYAALAMVRNWQETFLPVSEFMSAAE